VSTNGQSCENCKHFGATIAESPICQECISEDWLETVKTGGTRLAHWTKKTDTPADSGQGEVR